MDIPEIKKEDDVSDGSFFSPYSKELVKAYLFDGFTFRELDNILKINGVISKGHVSNYYINRYLGLKTEFKGLFKDMTVQEALNELKSKADPSYNELISILETIGDEPEDTHRIPGGNNQLYYGVPGCGKSHYIKEHCLRNVDEKYIERVLFYPDYTYVDFIGQILPEVKDGDVSYKFTPGPFTSILEKAFNDPRNKYYLVIEEINRGNAPAIFGDIFQLLDRIDIKGDEYPIGTSVYSITNKNIAEYIYDDEKLSIYGNKIRIPSNLSIIASMNCSDQMYLL